MEEISTVVFNKGVACGHRLSARDGPSWQLPFFSYRNFEGRSAQIGGHEACSVFWSCIHSSALARKSCLSSVLPFLFYNVRHSAAVFLWLE